MNDMTDQGAARVARLDDSIASLTHDERRARGKDARSRATRSNIADWRPSDHRPDPLALLDAQNATRFPDLVPLRWGRMAADPFAFYRGSAAVMAADLSTIPVSGLVVQACGDAHLQNFGLYASPERAIVFDLNDFDETLPGPWEWDLARLATSFVLAVRSRSLGPDAERAAVLRCGEGYRAAMVEFAGLSTLDVWYRHADAAVAMDLLSGETRAVAEKAVTKARRRTGLQALERLTELRDGHRVIVDDPPVVDHLFIPTDDVAPAALLERYLGTLSDDRRALVERYTFVDAARKVVGVGSVGTHCFISVGVTDPESDDAIILQVKEATASVLSPYLGESGYSTHGHRVVSGQRMMQATSDLFLGWTSLDGRDFYVRQLRDMKGSFDPASATGSWISDYAEVCGRTLARAHARSGDPIAIAAYLGSSDRYARSMVEFALRYAELAEADHALLRAAVDDGRFPAIKGQ